MLAYLQQSCEFRKPAAIDSIAVSEALNTIDYFSANEKRSLPPHVLSRLRALRLFSMSAPRALGGLEMSPAQIAPIVKLLGFYDCSIAVWVSLHNLLSAPALYEHGADCLGVDDLEAIARGDRLVAYALTEEEAGSDPRRIRSTAIQSRDEFILSGRKCWTGIGVWAEYTLFFAQTRGSDGDSCGITAFLLAQASDKVEYLGEHFTLGLKGVIQNSFRVDNLTLTADRIVGELGRGLEIAKGRMAAGRMAVAAMACGALARCLVVTTAFGEQRLVATGRLSDNPAWEFLLNSARVSYLICEHVLQLCIAAAIRNPADEALYYTTSKIINSILAHHGVDLCVQALGGRGYDEEFGISRFLRDTRVFSIFEGSNGSLVHFIGRSVQAKIKDGSLSAFADALSLDAWTFASSVAQSPSRSSQRERIAVANQTGMEVIRAVVSMAAAQAGCDVPSATSMVHHVLQQQLYDSVSANTTSAAVKHMNEKLQTLLNSFGPSTQPTFPLNFSWAR